MNEKLKKQFDIIRIGLGALDDKESYEMVRALNYIDNEIDNICTSQTALSVIREKCDMCMKNHDVSFSSCAACCNADIKAVILTNREYSLNNLAGL